MSKDFASFFDGVIRDIAELPDRTSPEGRPDMMLVTAIELEEILINNFRRLGLKLATNQQMRGSA